MKVISHFKDDGEELTKTINSQPCILTVSLKL